MLAAAWQLQRDEDLCRTAQGRKGSCVAPDLCDVPRPLCWWVSTAAAAGLVLQPAIAFVSAFEGLPSLVDSGVHDGELDREDRPDTAGCLFAGGSPCREGGLGYQVGPFVVDDLSSFCQSGCASSWGMPGLKVGGGGVTVAIAQPARWVGGRRWRLSRRCRLPKRSPFWFPEGFYGRVKFFHFYGTRFYLDVSR